MMKVAIITVAYGQNYGNRLQNYALQTALQKLGVDVETFRYRCPHGLSRKQWVIRFIKLIIKKIIRPNQYTLNRMIRFERFNRTHIVYGHHKLGTKIDQYSINRQYDFYVCGSDQIWNAYLPDVVLNLDYLLASFAPPEKRIAYSASFGQNSINEEYRDKYVREIPLFKAISVREIEGIPLVEQCGSKAIVTLDPTLLLLQSDWEKVEKHPRDFPEEEYIACYFLGERGEKMEEHILEIANGRRGIHINDINTPPDKIDDPAIFTAAPDEFLWIIAHAAVVLTDSFHGTSLSICFHRPFQVFERLSNNKSTEMSSRIRTLLSIFHLEHCWGNAWEPEGAPGEIDWLTVEEILKKERNKSFEYLKKALDLESTLDGQDDSNGK